MFNQQPLAAYYGPETLKIEVLTHDTKAKNRLKDDLTPIEGLGKPRVSTAFILGVVEQFLEEVSSKAEFWDKISLDHLLHNFIKATAEVLRLRPSRVSIQATAAPGLYIWAEVGEENLHLDLNFNEQTGLFEEAVVNIFLGPTQKLNVFGPIENITSEVRQYFDPTSAIYKHFISHAYAIPEQTYSLY